MLQAIRDKAQGWIAWVIVILISVPFALWGIQEYLGVGDEPIVAQVDGTEITERELDRRARNYRDTLRARLGASYRPDLISEEVLRAQMREQLIDERVLLSTANDWKLRMKDQSVAAFIRAIPSFQRDGQFDTDLYEVALRNQGLNRPMFETNVRQDMVMNQIRAAVRSSAFTTEHEIAEAVRLERQERELLYAVIPAEQFEDDVDVTDQALQAYYEENQSLYLVPEEVSVQYLTLDIAELTTQVEVDDAQLRNYFKQHETEFRVPEERKMRHILVKLEEGADADAEARALEKATALKRRIDAGEDFAVVAEAESGDPGSAQKGGDLGWVEPGMMVEAFDNAGFELDVGVLSEPVRTEFGYHLIEVTEVKSGGEAGFESVRSEVEKAFRRVEAENRFYDNAERLATLAYENAGSLAPAAEQLGLEIRTTKPFSRASAPPELNSPKVLRAAFSADVLENGNNSEVIEITPERAVVLRVLDHSPEHYKPFAEVREQVEKAYRGAKAAEATAAAGQEALDQLAKGGGSLKDLAEAKGWKLEQPGKIARSATMVPRSIVNTAFSLNAPADGAVTYGGSRLGNGYAIIELGGVTDGQVAELDEDEKTAIDTRLRTEAGRGELESVVAALRSRADVELVGGE